MNRYVFAGFLMILLSVAIVVVAAVGVATVIHNATIGPRPATKAAR